MPTAARTLPRRTLSAREGEGAIDLRGIRQLVRDITAAVPEEGRLELARSFFSAALASYWSVVCAAGNGLSAPTPCPLPLQALSEIERRRAERTGAAVARHPKPVAAYLLSTLYTGLLPDDLRTANGVFFTPPAVVDALLDRAIPEGAGAWPHQRVLDPAAGGGAFVAPVAMRMARDLADAGYTPAAILEHVAAHLVGVEIDPFSAWMSHVFLEVALWDVCVAAGRRMPNLVIVADALKLPDGWRGGFDLVVGNPPYGRVTLAPEDRARFARSLYGHANLYGLFTDLAVRLVRDGGIIGYVTPASFLGGQYFKNLRGLLAEQAPPRAIAFIADRSGVFDRVLQETVLIVLGTGPAGHPVEVLGAQPSTLDAPCKCSHHGTFALPADVRDPWILPRTGEDAAFLQHLAAMPHRLSDYGLTVSTGPLVWNRHKPQLATRRGRNHYPLIWAESILPSGEFRFSSARRNHVPYFRLLPGQDHLLVREPVVLVQRTTAKEQQRRLVAAELPAAFLQEHGGAVVENHVNMVRRAGNGTRVSLGAVAALLNSDAADRAFRCGSGSVAVSAFEMESLPLPPPPVMAQLDQLLAEGASSDHVADFIRRAYRLPEHTDA